MTKTSAKPVHGTILLIILAAQLVSCNGPAQQAEKPVAPPDALKQIVDRGEMRVGYLVWEPTVGRDQRTGEVNGIYPDAVNEIAKALKVKVAWKESTLANFTAALNADQFDFFAGAVFITIPRSVAVAYTQPVAYVGNSAVVRKDGSFQPKTIAAFKQPKLKIAVLQGQAMEEYCKRNLPEAELLVLSGGDLTAPLAAVSAGRADAGMMNSVTVAKYAAEHPEVGQVLTGSEQVEVLPLAWATRHRDRELRAFLDSSITYLKATGRLEEYQKKLPVQLLYDVPALRPAR